MFDPQLKKAWEQRASEKGSNINSVLFQGLPDSLNQYIHDYHCGLIKKHFINTICKNGLVLDLGCGYGRLSELVKKSRADLEITGADISCNYCVMYRSNTGENVVCTSLEHLPFRKNSFAGVLAVTSLMYVDPEQRASTFENIIQLLKPGGVAIFVDPGEEFKKIAGILRPSAKEKTTGGFGFTRSEYLTLANSSSPARIHHGGMPFFSIFIPLLLILEKIPVTQKFLLTVISRLDRLTFFLDWFTVHRWMVVEKPRQ